MALNEYSLADFAAAVNGVGGNRNGEWGGDGAWWIILLIALLGGFNGGFGGLGGGYAGGNELYPWLNQSQNVNDGFRDQMLQTNVQGIQQGIYSLSTQLCNCCADMQMAVANGFANAETAANARQMATMQQGFGLQTAMMQGFNSQQAQTAQFAYDTGMGLANLNATILAENCADRAALSDGVRDIIASQVAGDQRILDKLCQLEMDGYKREAEAERRANDQLRAELTQARFDASQQAQNAYIQQGFANEVDALYNRLNTCPVPTTPVYGRTPIFTCQNNGCPCNG